MKSESQGVSEMDLPVKPGGRPAAATSTKPPIMPPRAPVEAPRAGIEVPPPRRLDGAAAPTSAAPLTPTPFPSASPKHETDMRKLIVGRGISLSGEINSCDRLVVEGSVEANLANCREIEISDTGVFKGSASIDDAEIHGLFDGILHVRRRLLIKATGKVTGTVRYGQIEIECGGQVSGDVQAQPSNSNASNSESAAASPPHPPAPEKLPSLGSGLDSGIGASLLA